MLIVDRKYLIKYELEESEEYNNVLLERVFDASLNIFIFNQYFKIDGKWVLDFTKNYKSQYYLDGNFKAVIDGCIKRNYVLTGVRKNHYSTIKNKVNEKQNSVRNLIVAYAKEILRRENKLPISYFYVDENYNGVYDNYLLDKYKELRDKGILTDNFNLEKEARHYIKVTNLKIHAFNGYITYSQDEYKKINN